MNVLSEEFTKEMEGVLTELLGNNDVKGVVLISKKPGCFIAGADIK